MVSALVGGVAGWFISTALTNHACRWYFGRHSPEPYPWNWRMLVNATLYLRWVARRRQPASGCTEQQS